MSDTHRVRIDTQDFIEDSKKLLGRDWPKAIVHALELTAKHTEMMERANTRENFKLHTDWIPKNINAFPKTVGQRRKIESDFRRRHEGFAAVQTSQNINWMSMHEDGGTKTPKGKTLSLPGPSSKNYSFLTATGKTKQKWEPQTLLKGYNAKPWVKGSKHPGERGHGKRLPFIIRGRGGVPLLVRRKTKKSGPLETLYVFKPKADIKATWHFEEKGYNFVKSNYEKYFNYALDVVIKKYSAGNS